jgi:hypothetical protein
MKEPVGVQKTKVGVSAFGGSEDQLFEYTVLHAQTKEPLGTLFLRNVKQPVIDRYRDIRNGDGARRKGDVAKAREFLFTKTFTKFEFIEEGDEFDLGECKTVLEFLLKKADKVVDSCLISYLNEVFPEVDGKK